MDTDVTSYQHSELREIEAALSRCAEIRDALVTVHEHRPGDERLIGYVVLNPGFLPHDWSIRTQVQRLLPAGLVPSAFVFLDGIPATLDGRIDVTSLPVPDFGGYAPPLRSARTSLERTLCGLFADVLGLPTAGIDDNFFESGGDSMLAARLIQRIREEAKLPLTADDFYAAPSVAELSQAFAPRDADSSAGTPSAAAATPVLDGIIELWKAALRADDLAADDDFFELGGNSIVAVRLIPPIKNRFGVEPHISVIFDHPTPRELADALVELGVDLDLDLDRARAAAG